MSLLNINLGNVLLNLNPVNVLLAVLFGAGVFAVVASLDYRPTINLMEIDKIYAGGAPELTFTQQLQLALDRARFNLSANEFLRVAAFLAVVGGLGAYLLTGIPIAVLFGAAMGPAGYWMFLSDKASKNMDAYEDELPQVVARLINAASTGADLLGAAEHVARFGPELCREDWRFIAEQRRTKAKPEEIFQQLSERRRSMLLDLILEMLLLREQTGAPFTEILPAMQKSLAERVRTLRKARTKLGEPMRDLQIVAATPFIAVLVFRFLSPTYAQGFASGTGEMLVAIGWTVTIVAYLWAIKGFSDTMKKETTFQSSVPSIVERPDLSQFKAPAQGQGRQP